MQEQPKNNKPGEEESEYDSEYEDEEPEEVRIL